jgi:hypothetical protein
VIATALAAGVVVVITSTASPFPAALTCVRLPRSLQLLLLLWLRVSTWPRQRHWLLLLLLLLCWRAAGGAATVGSCLLLRSVCLWF